MTLDAGLAALGSGLAVAVEPLNLLLCFVGVVLGTLVGVLPGVGPVVTISLLLPITFGMEPVTPLIMLAGIYYGAQYGGSTTAILLKLPGETAAVLTTLDGNAMAKKGRAGATVCPVPSAISIALGRGELQRGFENTGVKLNNVRKHADREVRESHYDQTQQNLFREGGNIPPLWSRSLGRDVRLIGVTWVEHYARLISLKSSGIRTPADLKGKRLGLVNRPNDRIDFTRATQRRGYLTALKAGNVSRDNVTFVDITYDKPLVALPPEAQALSSSAFGINGVRERQGVLVRALLEGSVDALYLTGPGAQIEALLDAEVVYDAAKALDASDRVSNLTPVAFTVKGELLDSQPDIVTEYVAANLRSARWARANPQEAARYVARDAAIEEEGVGFSYSRGVAAQLETSLDPELLGHLETQKRFLLEEGFIPNDFSLSDFVAAEPLRKARLIVDAESVIDNRLRA